MAAANQGDVEIILGDEVVTLRCTLGAAKKVNAAFGDYITAFRRLATFDLSAYISVVAAGLDKTPKEIEDAVFKNGMTDLNTPLSQYVDLLANGGKPPKKVDDKDAPPVGEG